MSETVRPLPRTRKRLTRGQKKAETRAALLDTAAMIFRRRGFYGAAVEEIAEEAGYSKGAVYSNFESKEDLFMTLLEQRHEEWAGAIYTLELGEPIETMLLKAGEVMADVRNRYRDWWLLFFELWTCATRDPNLEVRLAGLYQQSRTRLAELIGTKFKSLNVPLALPAEDIAAAVIALNQGFYLQKTVASERFPPEFLGQALVLFFRGLAPPGSGPGDSPSQVAD